MPEATKPEIKLFYCYAREDKELRDELEKHLSILKRRYGLRSWHDREILAGDNWQEAINLHLDDAHLILLLISPDFMVSEYCYGKEMQRAFERQREGTCRIIPIILRPTYWEDELFSQLQILPTDAVPVTSWPHRDLAFLNIAKEMSLVFKDLLISLKTKKDWLDEGIAFYALKRYDDALAAFEQALHLDSCYVEAYQEKGTTLHNLERYEEALAAFEEAIHLDEQRLVPYVLKGHTLNALRRYEEALNLFEGIIQRDHNQVAAYIGRDKALQQLGISQKAFEKLTKQLQEVRQRASEMEKQAEQSANQVQLLNRQIVERRGISEKLTKQLQEANRQITEEQKKAEQLTKQLQEARQQVADERKKAEQFANQLQAALQQQAAITLVPQTSSESTIPCPGCGNPVHLIDTICPHCGTLLAPTAYGLSLLPTGNALDRSPTSFKQPQKPAAYEETDHHDQRRFWNFPPLGQWVATRTDPGIKLKQQPNEDSIFALKWEKRNSSQYRQLGLYIVADGMRTIPGGQTASRMAVQALIDFLLPKVNSDERDDSAFLKLLTDSVQAANQALHQHNQQRRTNIGTTMTMALVVGSTAYTANVGDSRIYLYRSSQGLMKVTRDHSVVASLVESGHIKPDEIYTHPKRDEIYRSLGQDTFVDVDTFKVDLQVTDRLLLCSDGLWKMVRDPLIQDILSKPTRDFDETAQKLVKAALDGGGEENVSVIVVQLARLTNRNDRLGVQLLAKPDTVTL